MTDMVFQRWSSSDLVVALQTAKMPGPAEWDHFLALINDVISREGSLRVLVFTDGAGPDANLRRRIAQTVAGRSYRTAVVTNALMVRTMLTAASLILPYMRGFSSFQAHGALEHLRVPSTQTSELMQFVDTLAASFQPLDALRKAVL